MRKLDSPPATRTVLPRGLSYFEYQRLVCSEVLIPWLAARLDLAGLQVGDFGAHHGGMLDALRDSGLVAGATGLELSADVVASSPFVGDERFRLEVADVMARDAGSPEFDLVLMHDVLEHIPERERALGAVHRALAPGGHVFVSFPPYYSAFGGHHQLAAGRIRLVPFAHLLPAGVFFGLARPSANEYLNADDARRDMLSVRRARLTLRAVECGLRAAGLEIVDRELYVVRPEYTVRYGMKTRRARVLGAMPLVRELAVNGAFYLARRPR